VVGLPLGADREEFLGFSDLAGLAHPKKHSKNEVKKHLTSGLILQVSIAFRS
jgi:hypothetical protein